MKPEPLSVLFLLKQGSCCGSSCHHCPYLSEDGRRYVRGTITVDTKRVQRFLLLARKMRARQVTD